MNPNNFFSNTVFSDVINFLRGSEKIIITTHINPDGDAIGSSMALYYALIDKEKNVDIIISDSKCPDVFSFLPQTQKIIKYKSDIHKEKLYSADAIVIVDVNDLSRLKNMEKPIKQSPAKKVLIDHHINSANSANFADYSLSDTSAIATGEIVFTLLELAKIKINKKIADALYCAIYTDSGGFRFANTSPKTHRIVASLLEYGTRPDEIYEKIYNTNSLTKMHLQGLAIANMKSYLDGQLTIISVPKEIFRKTCTTNEDTENLSQVPLAVKGTKVGILIIEYEEKLELRVSLRSKGEVNVQQIALKYGGGGHLKAAGCKLQNMTIKEAKQMLLKEVKNIL